MCDWYFKPVRLKLCGGAPWWACVCLPLVYSDWHAFPRRGLQTGGVGGCEVERGRERLWNRKRREVNRKSLNRRVPLSPPHIPDALSVLASRRCISFIIMPWFRSCYFMLGSLWQTGSHGVWPPNQTCFQLILIANIKRLLRRPGECLTEITREYKCSAARRYSEALSRVWLKYYFDESLRFVWHWTAAGKRHVNQSPIECPDF